jgi:hypothetical protein
VKDHAKLTACVSRSYTGELEAVRRPSQSPVSRFDGKKLLVLVSIMVVVMMVDSEIGFVADFVAEMISSPAGIALFICIAVMFAVLQCLSWDI